LKKYALIVGGGFSNKGAQSMSFSTVYNINKRFPKLEIVLLSDDDFHANKNEQNKYTFQILPINFPIMLFMMGGIFKFISNFVYPGELKKAGTKTLNRVLDIYNNAEIIFDISGYGLSSQLGVKSSLVYLLKIKLAKKFKSSLYIMPQSFGPFNYKKGIEIIMDFLIKRYMKYPSVVFARENEGYELLLNKYNLTNLKKSFDLVLLNKELDLTKIYKKVDCYDDLYDMKDVAIIPNKRNFKYKTQTDIFIMYDIIIRIITNKDKKVFLISHSIEDYEICKMIKERNIDNSNLVLIDKEMNCIEFNSNVKKFDFLIASRYHSVVHAYKNYVPCIVLGWATKYAELLHEFSQGNYMFDIRTNVNMIDIERELIYLSKNYSEESKIICTKIKEVQRLDIMDEIWE